MDEPRARSRSPIDSEEQQILNDLRKKFAGRDVYVERTEGGKFKITVSGSNGHKSSSLSCKNLSKNAPDYAVKRAAQLAALKEWERQINIESSDPARIYVENDVDLTGPPEGFSYIAKSIEGSDVQFYVDPIVGCECRECNERSTCCARLAGHKFAFDEQFRVVLGQRRPIYECSSLCKCGKSCRNRVVQRGRQYKLAIFRTRDKGWGVKALEPIPKNAFVMEYVGEIITLAEAKEREKLYDRNQRTFLFDLDFSDGDINYTIDAAKQGNVAHFLNHSCCPNLVVYCVYVENLDRRMPRIAFFSTRRIAKGEELTFNYRSTSATADSNVPESGLWNYANGHSSRNCVITKPQKESRAKARIICLCGTDACTGFIFDSEFAADADTNTESVS